MFIKVYFKVEPENKYEYEISTIYWYNPPEIILTLN